MASVGTTLRRTVGAVSPRRRQYQRLLDSCRLDPATLAPPLRSPGVDDVIICGCPRSGTALLTAALHQPPVMVSVMEPWDGLRLPPADLFASLRGELAEGFLDRGRLDLDRLAVSGDVTWTREDQGRYAVDFTDETAVAVKWPTFWQYLPLLTTTRFLVCVRHPGDVVDSFRSQAGRLHHGLEYDVAFNRRINGELASVADVDTRRLRLYDLVNSTVLDHIDRPNVHLVRYEDWHDDPVAVLEGVSAFLDRDLTTSPAKVTAATPTTDQARRAAIVDRSTTARALGY
ncbi:MAG: sulfotransferase [Acidimicrobiales bacterium]